MMAPKMTLAEVCTEMRKHGISVSNSVVGDAIEDGTYPFGRLVSKSEGGRRTFEIWRKDFVVWLERFIQQPSSDPNQTVVATPIFQIPMKTAQVLKWTTVCSNPWRKEAECAACPYRQTNACTTALLADAASVLMDITLGAVTAPA